MVVRHIVLLKCDLANSEALEAMVAGVCSLQTRPGVLAVEVGQHDPNIHKNYVTRNQGYTHYIRVDLQSPQVLH
eukprot:g4010.t1